VDVAGILPHGLDASLEQAKVRVVGKSGWINNVVPIPPKSLDRIERPQRLELGVVVLAVHAAACFL